MISRRLFLLGAGGLSLASALGAPRPLFAKTEPVSLEDRFAAIEESVGGRLGVSVLNKATGLSAARHGDELFPMCSTFKLLAVAAVLHKVDEGDEMLSRKVPVPASQILDHAPVTKEHAGGDMTMSALCAAAMVWSDNTAANLILESLGGPSAVTAYVRSLGDQVTRIDRMEPDANDFGPGEERDTTSPNAMLDNLNALFLGEALTPLSRDRLTQWFRGSKTGNERLRAGLPKTWRVGDRTGTGPLGTSNDVAVAWPEAGAPVLITAYLTGSKKDGKERDRALADVGRAVAEALA